MSDRGPGKPPKGRVPIRLYLSPRARAWLEAEAERRHASMADVADDVFQACADQDEQRSPPEEWQP